MRVSIIDPKEIKPWIRIFGAVSYLVLTLISLTANTLLFIVIVKGRKKFSRMPFFIISFQMLITDFISLIFIHLLVGIPTIFVGDSIYSKSVLQYILALDTVYYWGFLYFCFLLMFNRFCVFIIKPAEILFEKRYLYIIIAFIWAYVIMYTIVLNLNGITKNFNAEGFHLETIVSETNENSTGFKICTTYDRTVSLYLPRFLLAIYILIFIEIKFNIMYLIKFRKKLHDGKAKNFKAEIKILIQSVLISSIIELENWSYNFGTVFGYPEGDGSYFLTFAQTWIGLVQGVTKYSE